MSIIQEKTSDEINLPASRKIYFETNGITVNQDRHNLRVPFREIALSPSKDFDGSLEANPPVRVYDTSGVWTDPEAKCNVRDGLPALRRDWIVSRGDVEEYEGREILPQDNGYLTRGSEGLVSSPHVSKGSSPAGLEDFITTRRPLRAKRGHCVTQMHYARKGIITPEMEYHRDSRKSWPAKAERRHLAGIERDDRSSLNHQHKGESFGASIPDIRHARIRP